MTAASPLAEHARAVLHGVVDPELGLDIVDLGLVYDIRQEADGVVVDMTLTTPGCPVSESLPTEAGQALEAALGVPARVVVVWDPPWTPDRIDPGRRRSRPPAVSLTMHGCFPGPDDADAAFDGPSDYVVEWQLETERAGGVDLDLAHEHAGAVDACVIDPS